MLSKESRISDKKTLHDFLEYEHAKYANVSGIKYLFQLGEQSKLWKHQMLLRKAEYYTNSNNAILGLWYRYRLNRIQDRLCIHIPLNTCDRGLKIMHVGPVLLNWNVTVGKDCVLHMNTGLVAGGTTDDAPILEDNVIIGFGAVVVGGTRIANGVAVGANAVVNKSIDEPNITVAGVPAKKISNHSRADWAKTK